MMGIPHDFATYIPGNNKSVQVNSSLPTSVSTKKLCSIAYHFVREGTSRDELRIGYVSTNDNMADLLSKPIPNGEKIIHL